MFSIISSWSVVSRCVLCRQMSWRQIFHTSCVVLLVQLLCLEAVPISLDKTKVNQPEDKASEPSPSVVRVGEGSRTKQAQWRNMAGRAALTAMKKAVICVSCMSSHQLYQLAKIFSYIIYWILKYTDWTEGLLDDAWASMHVMHTTTTYYIISCNRTLDSTMTVISGKSLIFWKKTSISERSSITQIWRT